MKMQINDKVYNVSPSFMTMVKYRCEYGLSIMQEEIANVNTLIQLLYVAISDNKPFYHTFKSECQADSSFELSALTFYKALLLKDCPPKQESESRNSPDEFEILALCTIANIGIELLDVLNIFQVVKLINKYCEVKNSTPKPKEMNSAERKSLYGITSEKETEIEAFLLKQEKEKPPSK